MRLNNAQPWKIPRLATLISGVLILFVVLVLIPGGWLAQRFFEDRLITREVRFLKGLSSAWTVQFSSWLDGAHQSISRYAEAISEPDLNQPTAASEFDRLVELQPDGAWRSLRESFDPEHESGIWLQKDHPFNEETKQFFFETKQVTDLFGLGLLIGTINTWTLPKEGGIVIFWPSLPEWVYGASADLDYTTTDWVTLTHPDRNPEGVPRWTPTSYDPAARLWMISIVAPFTRNGHWAGAVGHDLPLSGLNDLVNGTSIYPGTHHILVKKDGTILTSERYQEEVKATQGHFRIQDTENTVLIESFADFSKKMGIETKSYMHFSRDLDQVIIANNIAATDWILMTTIPAEEILATVRSSFRTLAMITAAVLLVICLLPALLIALIMAPQVKYLLQGTQEISHGNLDWRFKMSNFRESQQIEKALNQMVAKLRENISEIKDASAEIEQLNIGLEARVTRRTAQLEGANKELEAFSYSVSHDLRAPVRAIKGFSAIVLEEGKNLPAELQTYLQHISDSGDRMELLINDLLQFSRLSKKEILAEHVDLHNLFRETVAELQHDAAGRVVDCRVNDIPAVRGDLNLLKQVTVNLLENAFKYTRKREKAVIEVGSSQQGGKTIYYVQDNGVGFDMRYSDKLFGVFQRLHATEDFEGTGIGLALVKRIISRHSGQIWAEAEVDRGATFYFTLGAD